VAVWKTEDHLVDHYALHRGEPRCRSIEAYDQSAQETIALGVRFTYVDDRTGLPRVGYFHRDTSRKTVTDSDGWIMSLFQTDEYYVITPEHSTHRDD
jgi:hypothetical protein